MEYLPNSPNNFQVYAESVDDKDGKMRIEMLSKIGTPLKSEELKKHIDFAFLCLHGAGGEDGSIQGLFDYLKIPYSGSGIIIFSIGHG